MHCRVNLKISRELVVGPKNVWLSVAYSKVAIFVLESKTASDKPSGVLIPVTVRSTETRVPLQTTRRIGTHILEDKDN